MTVPASESDGVGGETSDSSAAAGLAADLFAARLPLAERYAAMLAGDGVAHGHIGPREVPRLWERHLLNCAVVTDLVPLDERILDVGSGAGLPGLALAIRRPDLQVVLLEPMLRRTEFLLRCVSDLGLADQVTVVRGRADDQHVRDSFDPFGWATARAVAPLERLVRWCGPLLAPRGSLLALKGITAAEELRRAAGEIDAAGFDTRSVSELRVGRDVSRVVVLGRRSPDRTRQRGRR